MVFRLIGLGKKIDFCLIGLGNFFIPISPRCAKKVQAPPADIYVFLVADLSRYVFDLPRTVDSPQI